jgi:hypothetical protein
VKKKKIIVGNECEENEITITANACETSEKTTTTSAGIFFSCKNFPALL